jgi:hypothetical protein
MTNTEDEREALVLLTRGHCPWWLGFAKDQETYRSRARAKKRQQDEENDKFNQLLARVNEQQQHVDKLRGVVRQ